MARVLNVIVSGTLENVVFYRRMGRDFNRIKREHIQQTLPTKIRGINFGIASRAAKGLRKGLQDVMPFPKNRSMQSRFSGAIAKWLGRADVTSLPPCDPAKPLNTFQFTAGAWFTERFKAPITVTSSPAGGVTVDIGAFIPAKDIIAPADTSFVKLTLSVAGCMLAGGIATGSVMHTIDIPYNNIAIPAQSLTFNIPVPQGSLTVTAARLQYYKDGNSFSDEIEMPAWMPAGVLNARYS